MRIFYFSSFQYLKASYFTFNLLRSLLNPVMSNLVVWLATIDLTTLAISANWINANGAKLSLFLMSTSIMLPNSPNLALNTSSLQCLSKFPTYNVRQASLCRGSGVVVEDVEGFDEVELVRESEPAAFDDDAFEDLLAKYAFWTSFTTLWLAAFALIFCPDIDGRECWLSSAMSRSISDTLNIQVLRIYV